MNLRKVFTFVALLFLLLLSAYAVSDSNANVYEDEYDSAYEDGLSLGYKSGYADGLFDGQSELERFKEEYKTVPELIDELLYMGEYDVVRSIQDAAPFDDDYILGTYVGDEKMLWLHKSECSSLKKVSYSNYVLFYDSPDYAIKLGYKEHDCLLDSYDSSDDVTQIDESSNFFDDLREKNKDTLNEKERLFQELMRQARSHD